MIIERLDYVENENFFLQNAGPIWFKIDLNSNSLFIFNHDNGKWNYLMLMLIELLNDNEIFDTKNNFLITKIDDKISKISIELTFEFLKKYMNYKIIFIGNQ